MAISLEEYVNQLSQSGLVSAADVSAVVGRLAPARQPKDADTSGSSR